MAAILDTIKSSAVGQAVSHLLDTKLRQQQHDVSTAGRTLDLSDEAAVGRFQEFLRIPTMTIEGATSQSCDAATSAVTDPEQPVSSRADRTMRLSTSMLCNAGCVDRRRTQESYHFLAEDG